MASTLASGQKTETRSSDQDELGTLQWLGATRCALGCPSCSNSSLGSLALFVYVANKETWRSRILFHMNAFGEVVRVLKNQSSFNYSDGAAADPQHLCVNQGNWLW